jgi:D-lactate dehydrogenase
LNADTAGTAIGAEAACSFVNDRVDAACLEKLAALGVRVLALRCAGFNHVDRDAAERCGIAVVRVPQYSPYAVAEHTVALLLTLNRKIHRSHNRVREQNFSLSGLVGFDLHGKTAGILGAGKIGRLVAGILRGFGMRTLVYDLFPDEVWARSIGAEYAPLDRVISEADVLSLHLPLTKASRHILDGNTFSRMKPGAFLLNTGRGALVDSAALTLALKTGRLGGAALDVYEEEAGIFFEDHSGDILSDDTLARLTTFPNVLITSHQAFLTREALTEISRVTAENISRITRGEPPLPGTSVT